MIAKHIALRSPKRSNFAALASYITDPQNKSERLGSVNVTNCEAASLQAVICEVLATQLANSRAQGDKTYHLLLSFPAGEYPNDDKLKKIEARICDGLGFAEHQRISAVHRDTDNLHLHIAINKIHPTKNTFFEPFQAYKTLASLCVELEKEHRLREENHQAHQSVSQGRVADMEHHSGAESLSSWLKRECLSELRAAATWQALHQVLSEHDLEIRPRANGLVIGSAATAWVKASTIARDLGKSQLYSINLKMLEAIVENCH
ncbi:MAG: TraI/MobA(P) family conjugative relaxase [Vibrionaceae bacterium]